MRNKLYTERLTYKRLSGIAAYHYNNEKQYIKNKHFVLIYLLFFTLLLPITAFSQGQRVYWADAATSNVLGNTSNWRYGSPYTNVTQIPISGFSVDDTLVFAPGLLSYAANGKIMANQNSLQIATIIIDEPNLTIGTTANPLYLRKDLIITQPVTFNLPMTIDSALTIHAKTIFLNPNNTLNVGKDVLVNAITTIQNTMTIGGNLLVEDSLTGNGAWTIAGYAIINAITMQGGNVTITGDLTVNDKFTASGSTFSCYNLTVNDTMTTYNTTYINKNLEVNGWVSLGNIATTYLQGNRNATIYINPLVESYIRALSINKSINDTVILLSDINMPTSIFSIGNSNFYTQGHNILLTGFSTNSNGIKDFSTTNLTLSGSCTFQGTNHILGSCHITTPVMYVVASQHLSIGSVHFKSTTSCLYYTTPLYSDTIGKIILETPSLGIWTYNQTVKPAIHIKDSIVFLEPASIVTKDIRTLAVKNIKDYGQGCVKSSINSITLDTIPPLNLYLLQPAITTANLNFLNVNFTGGNWTADKTNDLGLNTGSVTWNGSHTQGRAFYWVGNNGNTNDPTHWAFSSGGPPQNANGCLPSVMDTVYIDQNSCTANSQAITVNTPLSCAAFFITDPNRRAYLTTSGNYQLSSIAVHGNANLSGLHTSGMTSINLLLLGSSSGNDTIFTGNLPVFGIDALISFQTIGTYNIIGDIKPISAHLGFIEHKSGLLRTNGYNITASYFNSFSLNNAPRGLDFRNSKINIDGNRCEYSRFYRTSSDRLYPSGFYIDGDALQINYWDFFNSEIEHVNNGMSPYPIGGTQYPNSCTFSNCAGRSFYNFTTIDGNVSYHHIIEGNGTSNTANPMRFNKISVLEDTRFQTFGFKADTLQLKMGKRLHLYMNNSDTTQVDSLFEVTSLSCNILTSFLNDNTNSTAHLKLRNKTQLPNVSTRYLNVASSGDSLLINNGINGGNNTGKIKFDTLPDPPKVFYWVGNAGNWTDGSHWSIGVSGGDPLITNPDSCLPAALDSVVFDINSFSLPNQVVGLNAQFYIHALTWTSGVNAYTPTFYIVYQLLLTGCLEWASNMQLIGINTSSYVHFQNKAGTPAQKITSNGTVFIQNYGCGYTFNGTGRYDLIDDLAVTQNISGSYYPAITISSGSFYAHQNKLIATDISIAQSGNYMVDISGSDLIFSRNGTINVSNTGNVNFITDSNTNLLNGNWHTSAASLTISNQVPLYFGIIQRADSSITVGRTATCNYTYPVHARKYITQSSNNTFTGLWVVDTLEFIYEGDMQKQATLTTALSATQRTKITINKALLPHNSPCQSLLMQASNPLYNAKLRFPNCDTIRYVNLKKVEADTTGLACMPTIIEPRTEANPDAEHPNFNTIITPPVSQYKDTILTCDALSYLYEPMADNQANYTWSFGSLQDNILSPSALTDHSCYVDSVGTYKAIIDFTPTYGECQYVYQLKVVEILDTVKPQISANNFSIAVIDSCYWVADSTLDALFSDCFLGEYYYSLTGATNIPRVDSTLSGTAFYAGITTVTVHARDSILPTYYADTVSQIPQPNHNTLTFTVTVIDTMQRFTRAPFAAACSDNTIIDLRDYVSNISLNDTVLFFIDRACTQPVSSLYFDARNNQTIYLYSMDTLTNCRGKIDSLYTHIGLVSDTTHLTAAICEDDVYYYNGIPLSSTEPLESFYFKFFNVLGCDSVVQMDLIVHPKYITPVQKVICSGSSYDFFGTLIDSVDTYRHTLQSIYGCDSVIELSLSFADLLTDTIHANICQGETYADNGFSENQEGHYQQMFKTTSGCDSLVTLYLTVNPVHHTLINETICEGRMYDFFGQMLSDSGTYTHTLLNQYGCDSVIELALDIIPTIRTQISDSTCEDIPYNFNGRNLTATGVYYDTLQSVQGCDSIVELTLNVNLLVPDFEITRTGVLCEDNHVELRANIDNVIYQWSTGETSQVIQVREEGIYSISVESGLCQGSQEIEVLCPCKMFVPNVFTPNNDNINDVFIPISPGALNSFSMQIYDRWGSLIYKTNSYTPWDGKTNGRDAVDGVYYCIIEYTSKEHPNKKCTAQSSVTLLR